MTVKPLDEMTDAELGAMTRRAIAVIEQSPGFVRLSTAAAAIILIRSAIEQNAGTLTLEQGGVVIDGQPRGNWIVTVRRNDAVVPAREDTPHILAGTLRAGCVDQAIEAFETLSFMRVGRANDTKPD